VGPRASLDAEARKKSYASVGDRTPAVQSVVIYASVFSEQPAAPRAVLFWNIAGQHKTCKRAASSYRTGVFSPESQAAFFTL
jgi:hypothetical protein